MSRKLVECVPNISEGRDAAKIKQVTDAIAAVPGVRLLDVDPGADTNRTVITFVGEPEAVLEGAFCCICEAARTIDMRLHHGAHPRMGATDVRPNTTFNTHERLNQLYTDCVQAREGVGKNGDWCIDFHQRFDLFPKQGARFRQRRAPHRRNAQSQGPHGPRHERPATRGPCPAIPGSRRRAFPALNI